MKDRKEKNNYTILKNTLIHAKEKDFFLPILKTLERTGVMNDIIAPVIKYTKSTHFQEAPFLSWFRHPSPKGGRKKCTVAQALAPSGGHEAKRRAAKRKWRFSA